LHPCSSLSPPYSSWMWSVSSSITYVYMKFKFEQNICKEKKKEIRIWIVASCDPPLTVLPRNHSYPDFSFFCFSSHRILFKLKFHIYINCVIYLFIFLLEVFVHIWWCILWSRTPEHSRC
jgi:hypothetical protein